jgi:hypothetical protein
MLNTSLLYRHDKPNEPTKEGPVSVVLFESRSPQFQQSAGANPLYSLSGTKLYTGHKEIMYGK